MIYSCALLNEQDVQNVKTGGFSACFFMDFRLLRHFCFS